MTENERGELITLVNNKYDEYRSGAKSWSGIYHGCVFISVIAGSVATLFLKLDVLKNTNQSDIAASLALLAAILTAITAEGGFNRKWRANRVSRSRTEQLKTLTTDPAMDGKEIRQRLNEIIRQHDEVIIGPEHK
jgi:hypothetical protein